MSNRAKGCDHFAILARRRREFSFPIRHRKKNDLEVVRLGKTDETHELLAFDVDPARIGVVRSIGRKAIVVRQAIVRITALRSDEIVPVIDFHLPDLNGV